MKKKNNNLKVNKYIIRGIEIIILILIAIYFFAFAELLNLNFKG